MHYALLTMHCNMDGIGLRTLTFGLVKFKTGALWYYFSLPFLFSRQYVQALP